MFATFSLERAPLSVGDLPGAFLVWCQNVGALAALGLAIFSLAFVLQQRRRTSRRPANPFVVAMICLALVSYLVVGALFVGNAFGMRIQGLLPATDSSRPATLGDWLLAFAGGVAILAVAAPVLASLCTRIRWRRIWAMARVTLKEAVRSRVVAIFSLMAVIFLFADWFVPYKEENQLRNYVRVVYWSIMPIFLITASLLGSFSIPADVKNQSIHTIVTKPVERFEIVLGRFLGHAALLTMGLAVISGLSLLYLARGINEKASEESYKARMPIYGSLRFQGTKDPYKGDSVGRMWDYRSYISGPHPQTPNAPKQYAIWSFDQVPTSFAQRDRDQGWVPLEFTFDIFRLTKARPEDEGQGGIYCTFVFADGRMSVDEVNAAAEKMRNEKDKLNEQARKSTKNRDQLNELYKQIRVDLAYKYGVYEEKGQTVVDYHTQTIKAPPELFKKLVELETESPRKAASTPAALPPAPSPGAPPSIVPPQNRPPMFQVIVSVDRSSGSQMLGVAPADLYLLANENPFWINFLKGVVGMWFTFLLVLGVAITCSTYLSGVISWLATIVVFGLGMFIVDIQSVVDKKVNGPIESMTRLLQGRPDAAQLESSTATTLIRRTDDVYRWFLGRVLILFPDISRYDLTAYVANGFDISWTQVLFFDNLIPLLAYLLPCAVFAFYLMNFREIANPT